MLRHLLLAGICAHGISVPAQWQWQPLPDFPGTPRDDAAAFSIECDVYVGTGMQVGWTLTNDWWRFDNWNGTWQPAPPLPASERQYCTAQSYEGIGYLFGGLDASGPLSELWSFDPTAQTWTPLGSLPAPGRYACASFTGQGKIYVYGGLIADGSAMNELWEYDIDDGTWAQRTGLPGVGRHRAAAPPWGGVILGGADAAYTPLDEVWSYSEQTDSWSQLPSMPEARYGGGASSWSGLTYVAGAVDGDTFRSDAMYLSGSIWASTGVDLPSGRRGGVLAESGCGGGWSFLNYGLGLDDNMVRCDDWFRDVFAFGMAEHDAALFAVFPNPAHERIHYRVAGNEPAAISIIDEAGRCLLRVRSNAQGIIDLQGIPAGAYTALAEGARARTAARFIKLP